MFVGISGFPMAVNLHEAGFKVISYDAFKGVYEKVQASGITMVEMLKEVSEGDGEVVISMFRDYSQNVEIIFSKDGLLSAVEKNLVCSMHYPKHKYLML